VEGASLYNATYNFGDSWTLFFAAKPDAATGTGADIVPAECSSTVGGNNSKNSVIAWASAQAPPSGSGDWNFTYKNVVMCGSTSEWTNQATVTTTSNGRRIIIYHDGPQPPDRSRKLHAECLFVGGNRVAGVYRQPLDATFGFNHCMSGASTSYGGLWAFDPGFGNTIPPIISSTGNGTADLAAKRYAVGPSERFKVEPVSGDIYAIKSLASGKYVCSDSNFVALRPSCDWATNVNAQFKKVTGSFGSFQLQAVRGSKWVNLAWDGAGNRELYTDADTAATAVTFDLLRPV
jgi:hypothetical protein